MLTYRHRIVSSLSCLSTLTALAVCTLADENLEEKRVALKDGDRIIFFGDSLTALAGQEAPKQHVTKGYVRIVRETLQAKHPDKRIEVEWIATGGHTVPDLLKRVDNDVIAKKPTIVVVQIECVCQQQHGGRTWRLATAPFNRRDRGHAESSTLGQRFL